LTSPTIITDSPQPLWRRSEALTNVNIAYTFGGKSSAAWVDSAMYSWFAFFPVNDRFFG
jgi:hypothetical protein